jgi:sulfide dehydrogenase cytochrome subunit
MLSARLAGLVGLALVAAPMGARAAEPVPLPAQGCVGCHGVRGTGSIPIPPIAGRPAIEIVGTMKAFAANERPGTIMGRIARGYTEADIAAIAAYFAAQR